MNAEIGSDVQSCGDCRWTRLRATFGPTAAGLLGGAFLGVAALNLIEPLCRNVAATYAEFPSLTPPSITRFHGIPQWLLMLAVAVGLLAPIATGAVVVWLVRPRDIWADFSAGLSAALACTLTAFVTCMGWLVALGMIVTPSIADMTLLSQSVHTPAGKEPSQALVEHYPDLQAAKPSERGPRFMAKIISDQVSGGIGSVWVGMLMALLSAGFLALCGTLTAGYLMRRGGNWRNMIWPYLEITVPATVAVGLAGALLLSPVWAAFLGGNPFGFEPMFAAGLIVASILVVMGSLRRWPWMPRLGIAVTWFILLVRPAHGELQVLLPILSAVLSMLLLVRLRLAGSGQMARATPACG